MAARGRDMLIGVSDGVSPTTFTTIGGLRSKSMSLGNESVDITTADEAPWRQLLSDTGLRTVSVSGSGVFDDGAPINLIENIAWTGAIEEMQISFANGDMMQGLFQVTSFEYTAEHTDAQQFSMSLESSSTITFLKGSVTTPSTSAFDLSNAANQSSVLYIGFMHSITMTQTGNKLYTTDQSDFAVYEWDLAVPGDTNPKPAIFTNKHNHSAQPIGIAVSSDGTKMMRFVSNTWVATEFNLSPSYSFSAPVVVTSLTIPGVAFGRDMQITLDGLRMFVTDSSNASVRSYTMSSSYGLASLVNDNKTYVFAEDTQPVAFHITPSGTVAYMLGAQNDTVYQYTLLTANDITTMSYTGNSKFIGVEETIPEGMWFLQDQTTMYISGQGVGGSRIHRYTSGQIML